MFLSSQGLAGKLKASKPPISTEKEANKALAEKQRERKKKKKNKSDRNVRKQNERRDLEKRRRRQEEEGLPQEPTPSDTTGADDDDEDDEEEEDYDFLGFMEDEAQRLKESSVQPPAPSDVLQRWAAEKSSTQTSASASSELRLRVESRATSPSREERGWSPWPLKDAAPAPHSAEATAGAAEDVTPSGGVRPLLSRPAPTSPVGGGSDPPSEQPEAVRRTAEGEARASTDEAATSEGRHPMPATLESRGPRTPHVRAPTSTAPTTRLFQPRSSGEYFSFKSSIVFLSFLSLKSRPSCHRSQKRKTAPTLAPLAPRKQLRRRAGTASATAAPAVVSRPATEGEAADAPSTRGHPPPTTEKGRRRPVRRPWRRPSWRP